MYQGLKGGISTLICFFAIEEFCLSVLASNNEGSLLAFLLSSCMILLPNPLLSILLLIIFRLFSLNNQREYLQQLVKLAIAPLEE